MKIRTTNLRVLLGLAAIASSVAGMTFDPRIAAAHPMGNFSISHYAGIRIEQGRVEIRYILDMAEIPTFQELQTAGIEAKPDDPRVAAYLTRKAEELLSGLQVTVNGRPLALAAMSTDVIFPPGAGGLPTMKMGVVYRGDLAGQSCPCTLDYQDTNLTERAGWKEIVAVSGAGTTILSSNAASSSRSRELSNYPTDLINSPPQNLSARISFALPAVVIAAVQGPENTPRAKNPTSSNAASSVPAPATGATHSANQSKVARQHATAATATPAASTGRSTAKPAVVMSTSSPAPTIALQANKQGTPSNRFTQLITSNEWGFWFLLTAALIAASLGGLHALEPGHGKTIVAAYLVGSQGTAAHALLLGLIVTATHTAGVYALGLITLYASKYIVPDHLYPWLGVLSGLTIAGMGLYMLRRRFAGHSHEHGHHHHHGFFGHSHSHLPEAYREHEHDHTHEHDHEHDVVFADAHHHHEDHHHGDEYHAGLAHDHNHEHEHNHVHGHDHDYAHGRHHPHTHDHGHGHSHHAHDHSHGTEKAVPYRQLLALGITGGIVPCPAALVVLLSAVALHRVAFGLYLIVAFSVGLAAVLISIGMLTVYARRLVARVPTEGSLVTRWLPMASAAVITCLGAAIAIQGFAAAWAFRFKV